MECKSEQRVVGGGMQGRDAGVADVLIKKTQQRIFSGVWNLLFLGVESSTAKPKAERSCKPTSTFPFSI